MLTVAFLILSAKLIHYAVHITRTNAQYNAMIYSVLRKSSFGSSVAVKQKTE